MFRSLFPRALVQWIGPLIAIGLMTLVGAALVTASGLLDLSASTPHPEGWAAFLHGTFVRSVRHHADASKVPADLDSPSMVMKGATYFATTCAHCHGAPQLGQNPVALSMRPQPQYLPKVVGQYSAAELFYIVRHGVKYSAMPAWAAQTRDDEVWPVVAFLRAMPKLRYADFKTLAYGDPKPGPQASIPAFAAPSKTQPYQLHAKDAQTAPENLYAAPAFGFSDIQASDVVATCARCHGADGRGRAGGRFPNLTLQTETYLRDALNALSRGTRASAYMQTVATQLSPAQIDALARYYASLPSGPAQSGTADPKLREEGARIAAYGIKRQGTGACTDCHSIKSETADAMPRLEDQSFFYLVDQMRAFRMGGRGHAGGKDVMGPIARTMNGRQIAAVAAYYASTLPSAKPVNTARSVAKTE